MKWLMAMDYYKHTRLRDFKYMEYYKIIETYLIKRDFKVYRDYIFNESLINLIYTQDKSSILSVPFVLQ